MALEALYTMLVLRVQVNEEPPVSGGANDLGVLNAIVSGTGRLGEDAQLGRPDESPQLHLSLGGLTSRAVGRSDEHVRWIRQRGLNVGDRILVEVLDAHSADPVESVMAVGQRQDDEREYFEQCKRGYFELRSKYESEGLAP